MTAKIIKFPTKTETTGWTNDELSTLYWIAGVAVGRRFSTGGEIIMDDVGNPSFALMSLQDEAYQIITRFEGRYIALDRFGKSTDSDDNLYDLLYRSYFSGEETQGGVR